MGELKRWHKGELKKSDLESDKNTIKKFGYKTKKRKKYKGKKPEGIPVYKRSITRIRDKDTGEHAIIRRSTKYAGKESEHSRKKESFEGPKHMMSKAMRDKLKIKKKKKKK